jgi:hypothetical protein
MACDKVVLAEDCCVTELCVKASVRQSCVSKIVRTKLVCDKVVCESCCVTKWRRRRGGGGGEGGGSGDRIKNKNPTQSCGELLHVLFIPAHHSHVLCGISIRKIHLKTGLCFV